jgi:hypothetical protein
MNGVRTSDREGDPDDVLLGGLGLGAADGHREETGLEQEDQREKAKTAG